MSAHLYILDSDGNSLPCLDAVTWGRWMERLEWRVIGRDIIETPRGPVEVSTVFLGVDHSFNPDTPPILFETCYFFPAKTREIAVNKGTMTVTESDVRERYCTMDEAKEGHERHCESMRRLV